MKKRCGFAFFVAVGVSACGGGGGSGGSALPANPSPPQTSTPGTTAAVGTLLDDAAGTPLSGVAVRLDPWIAYPTPGPTPTPILTTITDASGHFTIDAPNGTYLLVIGPDTVNTPPPGWNTPSPNATDTPIPGASAWRATIHDRLVLSGQTTLTAPTMPPQPLYTPPGTERSGAYRLAMLSPLTEAPCLLAWNAQRTAHGLTPAVADEWSTENTRAIVSVGMNPNGAGQTTHFLVSGTEWVTASGGANCAQLISYAVENESTDAANLQVLWFGGAYDSYTAQHSGYGGIQFVVDPRIYVDPYSNLWP